MPLESTADKIKLTNSTGINWSFSANIKRSAVPIRVHIVPHDKVKDVGMCTQVDTV